MSKKKVAFICVHNSCRSQIAEAFGKHLASDIFESYSAGTETKPQINQDAVRIMKESYGIDMEADGQYSKLICDIPTPDIVISMGCNVGCPFIGRSFDDNWGLEDPTGKSDEAFKLVMEEIRKKILELKKHAFDMLKPELQVSKEAAAKFNRQDELLLAMKAEGKQPTITESIRLFDNQDLCMLLQISKRTLQRYRSVGALPYKTLGKKTYYSEEDVLTFLSNHIKDFKKEDIAFYKARIHNFFHK